LHLAVAKSHVEQRLLDFLKKKDVHFNNYDGQELLWLLAHEEIVHMLEEETISIYDLIDMDRKKLKFVLANGFIMQLLQDAAIFIDELREVEIEVLDVIFSDPDIVKMLQNKQLPFADLLELHTLSQEHSEDFETVLEKFAVALHSHKGDYTPGEILARYAEAPLHLRFMAEDPTDILYQHYDDHKILQFAGENQECYKVDWNWIASQFREGSAAWMDYASALRHAGIEEEVYSEEEWY
jgi:hypothetical protein